MNTKDLRSPLGRAAGLGSAHSGVGSWWRERVSAIALVPLTIWFTASLVMHMGRDYATVTAWLRTPLAAIAMVLLLIALFWHMALGLQVVIEDYVHSSMKFPALIAMRFACFALAVAGITAVLRVVVGR